MRIFNLIFLIGGLLLSSCRTKPGPIDITGGSPNLTEIGEAKENDNDALPLHSDEVNQTNTTATFALGFSGQRPAAVESNGFVFHEIAVAEEILLQVISELPVKDIIQASQVCKGWYALSQEPALWRTIKRRIEGDYPASEATKERAKLHMLQVQAHKLTDPTSMERLIDKYDLNKYRSFVGCQTLAFKLLKKSKGLTQLVNDELVIQSNELAIERKMKGLCKGTHGYKVDYKIAVSFNEALVKKDNSKAICRKIFGLDNGLYGYNKESGAVISFIEHLIEKGNEIAVDKKVLGLTYGFYGYKKAPEAAYLLNESWIVKGSVKAMERKSKGLAYGSYGYKVDYESAIALNEALIGQANIKAIKRKIKGLINGRYGYDENLELALAFNNYLIGQDNQEAITKKVTDLNKEKYTDDEDISLYQPDVSQLKSWLQEEAGKGTRWACYLKAKGMRYGILGFEKDQEAAIQYITTHNIPY
jgi:hypothetical protein